MKLHPAGAVEADRIVGQRLGHLFREAQADERGFFQFQDVTPGLYQVEARLPGYAPASLGPLEVIAGLETEVPSLVLALLSELALFVDPSVPPGTPERWTVELHALDGSNAQYRADTDFAGSCEIKTLRPALYRMQIRAGRSIWSTAEIEVSEGRSVRHVEIPVVAVEGTVRRSDEPVRARLDFGGERSRPEEVSMYSDHDGRFSGHLPGEGKWPVAVVLEPRGAEQRLDPVEVERKPGDEAAELEIDLPETVLAGRVVDSEGRSVPKAPVLVWREESAVGSSKDTTDGDGDFRFLSLTPGHWYLQAFSGGRSGRAEIELREGEPKEVEIRLSSDRRLRGRVTSPSGAVAGAWIYAMPEVSRITPMTPTKTDPLGAFEQAIPADAAGVHLLVLPPGRAARLQFVPMPPDGGDIPEIEVAVDNYAGTLHLELPPPGSGRVDLRRGAARVPARLLKDWAQFHGARIEEAGTWTIGGMEAGQYELCRAGRCDIGFLAPGRELSLSLETNREGEEGSQ